MNSMLLRKNTVVSGKDSNDFHKSMARLRDLKDKDYQTLKNQNLKRFEAMYIPTLPSNNRKSACHMQST
jgi:hypothetical protein